MIAVTPVVNYGAGLAAAVGRAQINRLQAEMMSHPQYEPVTKHRFHGGMYCREVWRAADVMIVGKVHRKEHFYMIVSGTVLITTDDGAQRITGPALLESMPGTKRAVYAETDALCMTFHRTDALTLEDAEVELVEEEISMFGPGNLIKNTRNEVIP